MATPAIAVAAVLRLAALAAAACCCLVSGALVNQQLVHSSFLLTVTAQLLVPEAGDCGLLSASLPALGLKQEKQVRSVY
jgi:hypothetical protein